MRIKFILKAVAAVLAVIIPFFLVASLALLLPPQYDETFVGALDEKVLRLSEINEPKIVVVGGSSVAFGLDSKLLSDYTGMPVVNFGLYAALGTKLMLDLSRDYINEGDVVVLAPELDAQTLSLYFNSETTLQALDGNTHLISKIPVEHYFPLLSSTWNLGREKLRYITTGTRPTPSGVYRADVFNEYGDIDASLYSRKENAMSLYYDPTSEVRLAPDIFSADFVDYLNKYIKGCERRGASVYYTFCPVNSLAVAKDTSGDVAYSALEKFIKDNIDATLISTLGDFVLDAGYFYDTNFHLNDTGVRYRTLTLARDMLLEMGIPRLLPTPPAPPPLPEVDVRYFGEDENAKYFEFQKLSDGSYMIVGVKEEYRDMTELTVPLGYGTYKVTQIGASAFSGTSLKSLTLTENTNIRYFMNGAFHGAASLESLVILYPYEADIIPPADFSGTADAFAVYVPEGTGYSVGYYWGERGLTFKTIKN